MEYLSLLAGLGVAVQDIELSVGPHKTGDDPVDKGGTPPSPLVPLQQLLNQQCDSSNYTTPSYGPSSSASQASLATPDASCAKRKGVRGAKRRSGDSTVVGRADSTLSVIDTQEEECGKKKRKVKGKKADKEKSEKSDKGGEKGEKEKEARKRRSGWLNVNNATNRSWRKILWASMHVRASSSRLWICEGKDSAEASVSIPMCEVDSVRRAAKSEVGGRDFCFSLSTHELLYHFQARSAEHCAQWCAFFERLFDAEKSRKAKRERAHATGEPGAAYSAAPAAGLDAYDGFDSFNLADDDDDEDTDRPSLNALPGNASSPEPSPHTRKHSTPEWNVLKPLPADRREAGIKG